MSFLLSKVLDLSPRNLARSFLLLPCSSPASPLVTPKERDEEYDQGDDKYQGENQDPDVTYLLVELVLLTRTDS